MRREQWKKEKGILFFPVSTQNCGSHISSSPLFRRGLSSPPRLLASPFLLLWLGLHQKAAAIASNSVCKSFFLFFTEHGQHYEEARGLATSQRERAFGS